MILDLLSNARAIAFSVSLESSSVCPLNGYHKKLFVTLADDPKLFTFVVVFTFGFLVFFQRTQISFSFFT